MNNHWKRILSMSFRNIILMTALVAGTVLTGCAGYDNSYGNNSGGISKQTGGTAIGAVLGGLAGSQFGDGKGQLVGTGVGVLLGALAGGELGKSLDRADVAYAQQAQQRAYTAPVGQTISWNNPQSGNSGTYTPVRDGRTNSGAYCREYQQTIYVGGQQQTATGQACQNPDGTWRVIN
jgi:surface antigen